MFLRTLPCLFIFSSAASADEFTDPGPDLPVTLERFEVNSDRTKSLTVPSVTAARASLSLTAGGAETIDAARYLRGRSSTVNDTFALSPGVLAQSRFGSDEARISIRGSGLQRTFHGRGLRILQDGVPLNLADGSFDMQAFEPLSAAYINVWRGGNALAHGASTLGGAIDYISRTGRDSPKLFTRLEAGSDRYLRTNVSGGASGVNFDAYGSVTHQSQDGFRDHSEQRNQRVFSNAGFRLSTHAETRLYLAAVTTSSELPGNLSKAQAEEHPRRANPANSLLKHKRDFDLLRIASKTTLKTGTTVWDFTAGWTYKDLDHPIGQVVDQLSNDLFAGATALHTSLVAGHENRLRSGVLFQRGRVLAANFANVLGDRGALMSAATQTATNVELFFEDQFALSRQLTLVLGASGSSNRRRNQQTFGATPHYDHDYSRLMPKVGLRWDHRDVQVYANLSGSYEPPSFSETLTLNTAREAQTATTWELGTRGVQGALRWDATIYLARLRNELLALDQDNNPSTPTATVNAGSTSHTGFEFGIELDLLGGRWNSAVAPDRRLVFRAAWTVGKFQFDDDPLYRSNVLPGLPPHLIRAELTWEAATGWYAGPTFEWVPVKSYVDHRNTVWADPYALLGFKLGRRQDEGFSWFVEARNLTNERYAATTSVVEAFNPAAPAQFLPGDGRSVYAGVEYRF